MHESEVTLEVLSPRGRVVEKAGGATLGRLSDLSGRKIGVLNNTKSGGEMLLPYLEEALKRRIPTLQLRTWRIPFAFPPELKEPRINDIVEYSDGVIALMGD